MIEAKGVSFSFDSQPIVCDFSTTIVRGDRVAIVGPNGSGKSTLIKLLLGDLAPDAGTAKLGTQLNVAYFDQERMQLDPERSVRDNLSDRSDHIQIGDRSQHVISYLRDFLFAPERVNSPVKTLSGGERNRLLLAKIFSKPSNLLVLDEPTNDLDVETLELLEDLLTSFKGTLLLVSHDRTFIDRTVTSTLVLEGQGVVREYIGGYSDWQRQVTMRPSKPVSTGQGTARDVPKKASSSASNKRSSRKLGFKDARELETLPQRIESLETQQSELLRKIAEPDFYQGAEQEVAMVLKTLSDLGTQLEQAYDRWAVLEELAP